MATAGQAAVEIDFNSPAGNVGDSNVYGTSPYQVTAYGYDSFNFATNSAGTTANLFDKAGVGDENGVGLATDPSHQNEIYFGGNTNFSQEIAPAVILDVSSLLAQGALNGMFSMGSTTLGEQWIVLGENGGTWTTLIGNGTSDGAFQALPGWGTYNFYGFVSGGTVTTDGRLPGNVLLRAITVDVPEPATWAMMILGFGAIGFSMRKTRRKTALAQLA
jgi:hypothetical protein